MPFGQHTLLLSLEGDLFAFGCNDEGQLGLGHEIDQLEPVKVPWNGPQPVQVDCGCESSLVLDAEGGVWDAGNSRAASSSLTFQRISELPQITMIAAGSNTISAALDIDGGVWVWTNDADSPWAKGVPKQVKGFPPLTKLACGDDFIVAEGQGGLWVFGDNTYGQLGLGHTDYIHQPTLVQVEELSEGPLRCLATQGDGVILIDSEGSVFSAGRNSTGQLGRPSELEDVEDSKLLRIRDIPPMLRVSCGHNHALSMDEGGGCWSWGCGTSGQLGTGSTSHQLQPTLIPSLQETLLVAGRYHSLAFPVGGGLLVFGNNYYGMLGLNHTTNLSTPTLSPFQPALPFSIRPQKKSANSHIALLKKDTSDASVAIGKDLRAQEQECQYDSEVLEADEVVEGDQKGAQKMESEALLVPSEADDCQVDLTSKGDVTKNPEAPELIHRKISLKKEASLVEEEDKQSKKDASKVGQPQTHNSSVSQDLPVAHATTQRVMMADPQRNLRIKFGVIAIGVVSLGIAGFLLFNKNT